MSEPQAVPLTIRELASRHNATLRALRFYEQKGLIKPTREGRKRLYSEVDAHKLSLIRGAIKLGFTLREIPALLVEDKFGCRLVMSPALAREQLKIMEQQQADVADAITLLRAMATEARAA